jgi:hypothetical protein
MSSVRGTSDGRGPVTCTRVPDRDEQGKPREDARRGRCHLLEAGIYPCGCHRYRDTQLPSTKYQAPHGAPRRDIQSPWRQLLSLPIPCHVHWPRSYCQSPAHPPDIYGKPCFRGLTETFWVHAGCGYVRAVPACGVRAGAAWVRGGSLGSYMRSGRRYLAPLVGGIRWAVSLEVPSSNVDTRARCAGGHVAGWATMCLPAVRGLTCVGAWAGAASGGYFGAFAWSPSGANHGCMWVGYCAERFLTMHTLRIARSSAHLRVPIDPARSQMPRNRLLPAPPAHLCALLLDVCGALHTKHALVVKT